MQEPNTEVAKSIFFSNKAIISQQMTTDLKH